MIRSLVLGALLLSALSGCASRRENVNPSKKTTVRQAEKRSWEQGAAAAYRRLDRAADAVGQVLYPPLYVAAFPLWFLSGFGGSGR